MGEEGGRRRRHSSSAGDEGRRRRHPSNSTSKPTAASKSSASAHGGPKDSTQKTTPAAAAAQGKKAEPGKKEDAATKKWSPALQVRGVIWMEEAKSQSGRRSSPHGVRPFHQRSPLLRVPAERPSVFWRHLIFYFFFPYLCISFLNRPTWERKEEGKEASSNLCAWKLAAFTKANKRIHMENAFSAFSSYERPNSAVFSKACRTVI